jgi:hypothetical protein
VIRAAIIMLKNLRKSHSYHRVEMRNIEERLQLISEHADRQANIIELQKLKIASLEKELKR